MMESVIIIAVCLALVAGAYVDYAERRRKKQEQIEKMYEKAIRWVRKYEVETEGTRSRSSP